MPTTPEFWMYTQILNPTTDGFRYDPHVTQLAGGNVLVTWTEGSNAPGPGATNGTDGLGQIYSAHGEPVGEVFRVNGAFSRDDERAFEIAPLDNGGFITVFEDRTNATSLRIEVHDAMGNLVTFNEFIEDVSGGQSFDSPDIAVSGDRVLITYVTRSPTVEQNIEGIFYDLETNTLDPDGPFYVFQSGGRDYGTDMAVLENGNFVVVTSNHINDRVLAAVFEPDGTQVVNDFVVGASGQTNNGGYTPTVTALTGGGFVVAFRDVGKTPGYQDSDIFYHVYNENGVRTAGDSIRNVSQNEQFIDPEVASTPDGGFIIFYNDRGPSPDQLRGQRFDADGETVGNDLTIDFNNYLGADSVMLEDGRVAVATLDGDFIKLRYLDTREEGAMDPASGTFIGTVRDDSITLSAEMNGAYGHRGEDLMRGTTTDDRIYGGSGNDDLYGGNGRDYLDGGSGADYMAGGLGDDFYVVDRDEDVIAGELAYSQNGGIDTVRAFIDYVQPTNIEIVRLGNLDDTENLRATGNDAPGTLVGNAGNNVLSGRGGNDQINGNGGDDVLIGNTGRDTLVGGEGADTFVFNSVSESRAGYANRDVVNGFDRGADRIDLSAMDADARAFGDQAFEFIGTSRFSGEAGELRLQALGGPNAVLVEGDVRGDGVADFQIFVNLTTTLGSDDFLL